jgi:hypothetical protein
MTKGEKIGSVTLGVLLFAGLFYFIYVTMKNPLPAEYGDDFYGDSLEEDLGDQEPALDEEAADVPEISTAPAKGAVK